MSYTVDVNVLLYASDRQSPFHYPIRLAEQGSTDRGLR